MRKIFIYGLLMAVSLPALVSGQTPIENRGEQTTKWQWITKNDYRIVMRCRGANAAQQHRIAWAEINFDEFYKRASSPKQVLNPDSIRVVEYDNSTGVPIKYDKTLPGDESYYVPAKIDEWPRRYLTQDTVRRPQLSWIRRSGDDAEAVYICYFDFAGSGEMEHIVKPAFIGSGDALAFASQRPLAAVRGTPMIIDWDNDGDNDVLAAVGMIPEKTVYFYENTGDSFNKGFAGPISIDARLGHITDVDNDGKVDVVSVGGYYSDVKTNGMTRRVAINCPMDSEIGQILKDSRSYKWYIADWDGDDIKDLLIGTSYWKEYGWADAYDSSGQWKNGPLRGWFYFFKNAGSNSEFKLSEPVKLFTVDGNPAEIYGMGELVVEDFTGDALPDIIAGDFIDNIHFFRNIGSKDKPLLAPRERLMTTEGLFEADYQAISVAANDYDNDGDKDLFIRGENDDTGLLENTGRFTKDGTPIFEPVRYLQCLSDYPVEGQLPVSSICDWDNDGDWDLIFGNSPGFIGWYECISKYPRLQFAKRRLFEDSKGPIRIIAGFNGSIQGPAEKKWGYTVPNAGDWDADGYPDIILNSIWGRIQWYQNSGSAGHVSLKDAQKVEVQWESQAPKPVWRWWNPEPKEWSTQWRSTVQMIDWDNDGLMDVAALDWEGYLVLHKRYMENGEPKLSGGKRIFLDEKGDPWHINPKKPGASGRRKFVFTDWDNDGDRDFIVDDKVFGGNVVLYINIANDQKPQFAAQSPLCDIIVSGHTCSPSVLDLEGDGKLDLLLAAEDGHFYCFHRSYIENKESLRAVIDGCENLENERNVVLFDENIAIGQIIGGQIGDEQSYSGKKSICAVKDGNGQFNVALDFKGNINILGNTKLVLHLKTDESAKQQAAELVYVQMYTYAKSAGGDNATNVKYYPRKTDEGKAAAFSIDGNTSRGDEPAMRIGNDGKWHIITLDLNSGPGMPQSGMLKPSTILRRLDFVFKSPAKIYIDDVYVTNSPR